MLSQRLSIWHAALAVLALQVLATAIAVATDWRTCFQKSAANETVAHAFVASGSAISAPLMPIVVLAGSALLSRRRDRWRTVGAAGMCLVAALFAWGAIGEALSSPSPQTPRAVLAFSGLFGLAQAALLVRAVLASRRSRRMATA